MSTSEPTSQESLKEPSKEQGSSEAKSPSNSNQAGEVQAAKKRPPKIHDPDDFLKHLGDILERLHTRFYTSYDQMQRAAVSDDTPTPDLKELIPQMRQSVLKGTKILFTGVVPTNIPPERCAEWNTARAFGAIIHDRLVPGLNSSNPQKAMRATTHVIAAKEGTSKLKEARRIHGIKIVSPRWLWGCAEAWRLIDERTYPVQGEGPGTVANHNVPRLERREKTSEPRRKQAKLETEKDLSQEIATVPTQTETTPHEAPSPTDDSDDIFYDSEIQEEPGVAAEKLRRHLSIETRLSVSEDELERMEAEVDAELGSSSSSSSSDEENNNKDELGGLVEEKQEDTEPSYEQFTGAALEEGPPQANKRKRKHADTEESGSSNSPSSSPLVVESVESEEERSSEEEESGDELAELLGGQEESD